MRTFFYGQLFYLRRRGVAFFPYELLSRVCICLRFIWSNCATQCPAVFDFSPVRTEQIKTKTFRQPLALSAEIPISTAVHLFEYHLHSQL